MEYKEEVVIVKSGGTSGMVRTIEELWRAALGEIELQVSRPNFITWFKNSALLEKREGTAFIGLPNGFAKAWVEDKYCKIVLGALRTLDEEIKKVEFLVQNEKIPASRTKPALAPEQFETQLTLPEFKVDSETGLNPRYTLGSFVVGKSNEFSHAAASAVVDGLGKKYNPLFIYGGVGVGKTHLMQAVGNEVKNKYQGRVRVRYVSSEKFVNEVVAAIRNRRTETMKDMYRLVDVLIVDDIQFIIGKTTCEEEFFHTFNALYETNKQIIISSDKPPKFMPNLAERLRSRFEGGMIADIGLPDYELKVAILRNRLQDRAVSLSEEVITFIANKIQKNFRELEGILNRILFVQKTKQTEITVRVAEQVIKDIIQEPTLHISPLDVVRAVAEAYEVSSADLTGQCRKKEVVEPRQIAMYLLRDILNLSYPSIGEKLGKRDHTTAIYAYEKISNELQKNQVLNQRILSIKELITKE